jgi:transcriptional regulator with XRE-family HTH domain
MLQRKLGQRIVDLRKDRRLTQAQFAKALKVEVVDLFTFTGRKPTRIRRLRINKRGAWNTT